MTAVRRPQVAPVTGAWTGKTPGPVGERPQIERPEDGKKISAPGKRRDVLRHVTPFQRAAKHLRLKIRKELAGVTAGEGRNVDREYQQHFYSGRLLKKLGLLLQPAAVVEGPSGY